MVVRIPAGGVRGTQRRCAGQGREPDRIARVEGWKLRQCREFSSRVRAAAGLSLPLPSGGPVRGTRRLAASRAARPLRRAASAAARSGGSGERDVDRRAGDRMREREPGGVQELARQPEQRRPSVLGVPRDGCPIACRCDADLVRAPGLERARAAARSRPAPRSSSKCVRASRGVVRVGRHARAHARGRARSARRSCRCAPAGSPPRAPGTRAAAPAPRSTACSARVDVAPTSRPRAGRRCRGRAGGRSPRAPGPRRRRAAGERLDERRSPRCPRAGCTTTPGRLVDDQQVLVLADDRERHSAGASGAGPRARGATSICSPPRDAVALRRCARRRRVTRPPSIAAARPRASRPGAGEDRRAARPPRRRAPQSAADRPIESSTSTSATTPHVIAMSATLNAGHSGRWMKSVT